MVIFERIVARNAASFVDQNHPGRSAAIYAMLLVLSPILLPVLVVINARTLRRWIPWLLSFRNRDDPYLRHDRDWPVERDMLLGMLIKRRRLFDPRLKSATIDNWPMRVFWTMPEATVLEAIDGFRDLRSGGAEEWQIWEKLDTRLDVDGPPIPRGSTIADYLRSRMRFIDPDFVKLKDRVLLGHVDICSRWLERTKPAESERWPPRKWLTKRLSIAEIESLEAGTERSDVDVPAVLHLSCSQRDLVRIKLPMLAGDEVWTFSSPAESWRMLRGRAGLALVRDGRVITHIVTEMN